MSEAKHTTGPWNVPFREFTKIKAANGAHIATCHKLTNLVNLEANSRLIAAAPDLLADLQEACDRIEDLVSRLGGTDPEKATESYRATIAKATGGAATYKEP